MRCITTYKMSHYTLCTIDDFGSGPEVVGNSVYPAFLRGLYGRRLLLQLIVAELEISLLRPFLLSIFCFDAAVEMELWGGAYWARDISTPFPVAKSPDGGAFVKLSFCDSPRVPVETFPDLHFMNAYIRIAPIKKPTRGREREVWGINIAQSFNVLAPT